MSLSNIKNIPILDVAERLGIPLHKKGKTVFTNCTNHSFGDGIDTNPSMSFDLNKNFFNCFSCSNSGSVIDLVSQILKIDAKQAIKWLDDNYKVNRRTRSYYKNLYTRNSRPRTPNIVESSFQKPEPSYPEKQYQPPKKLTRYSFLYDDLITHLGKLSLEVETYLCGERMLDLAVLKRFKICDISRYPYTSKYLKKRWSMDLLQKAGLFNEKGNFKLYIHKILFPLYDLDANPIYFHTRRYNDESPKYMNIGSDENDVPGLFAYEMISAARFGNKYIYICEGPIDAITLIQQGFNAVGVLGVKRFKKEWVNWFKDLNVVLVFDGDEPGKEAANNLLSLFNSCGHRSIKNIELPGGEDINSLFKKGVKGVLL